MIDALWSIEFESNTQRSGNGVMVLKDGRVLGGDSMMLYDGRYTVEDGQVYALVQVSTYAPHGELQSTVGLRAFTLDMRGALDENQMSLNAFVTQDPHRKLKIHAQRRAELE